MHNNRFLPKSFSLLHRLPAFREPSRISKLPSVGPPVPARGLFGSLAYLQCPGHGNSFFSDTASVGYHRKNGGNTWNSFSQAKEGRRTSKLAHEVWDHPVKMNTIVEASLGQIDPIWCCQGHLVQKGLNLPASGVWKQGSSSVYVGEMPDWQTHTYTHDGIK